MVSYLGVLVHSLDFTVTMANPAEVGSIVIIRATCTSNVVETIRVPPNKLQVLKNICKGEDKITGFQQIQTISGKSCFSNGGDDSIEISSCSK